MPALPRATKLNLAVRKQVRDAFESKKEDWEKEISDILGVPWVIDVDPLALYPYAQAMGGTTEVGFGTVLRLYITGAIFLLGVHKKDFGEDGVEEVNEIVHTHTITIDLNEDIPESKAFAYCGADIKDGKLRLLFASTAFGSNADQCLNNERLLKALAEAPPSTGADKAMSFAARTSILKDWEPKFAEDQATFAKIVGNPNIKFVPNFEDLYAKLKAESARKGTQLSPDWEQDLGRNAFSYYNTLVRLLPGPPEDFENDDMLKEGFNDAIESGEIALRIVDKLNSGPYKWCESQVEGGVLYLQTTAEKWGFNPNETFATLAECL